MKLAEKTLSAIDAMLEKDGGAKYRTFLKEAFDELQDAFSGKSETPRFHLGASVIGKECKRELWYSFRRCAKPKPEARVIRIFNRGHLEEARFVAMLRAIGVNVAQYSSDGRQYGFEYWHGHFAGSCDGIALNGIPDLPDANVLLEFKTHNKDSFKALQKDGVEKSKPEHYVQMCVYMHYLGLQHALYMAVNKNDDALHLEIVDANSEVAEAAIKKAGEIILATEPPDAPPAYSPAFYKCKFCNNYEQCHYGEAVNRHCRTCANGSPHVSGEWYCLKHERVIEKKKQLRSCDDYEPAKQL